MPELSREFLTQTISKLEVFLKESNYDSQNLLSENSLNQYFRHLHTIKGSSNTFDLPILARVAHEIESLVQVAQKRCAIPKKQEFEILKESLLQLIKIARTYRDSQIPAFPDDFMNRLKASIPQNIDEKDDSETPQLPEIPLKNLAAHERSELQRDLQNQKNIFVLKALFSPDTFSDDFKSFREKLAQHGKVIAVTACTWNFSRVDVCFQVYFSSLLSKAEIQEIIGAISKKITFEYALSRNIFTGDLNGTISRLITDSEKKAVHLGKSVAFKKFLEDSPLSDDTLLLLSNVLAHLLYNAVDHGIETPESRIAANKNPMATIEISVKKSDSCLLVELQDDGKGINTNEILDQAVQRNIPNVSESMTDREILELIFLPGFSTSEQITQISGRGVGLDAVKELVIKGGGTIELTTDPGFGTTFRFQLPIE